MPVGPHHRELPLLSGTGETTLTRSRPNVALRELKHELTALKRRADQLSLELVSSLLGMAILDIESALLDEEDESDGHLNS